jgi:CxxC motif-containing protein (DUF1111 family)
MSRLAQVVASTVAIAVMAGCSSTTSAQKRVVRVDRSDLPLTHANATEIERFQTGDALFEATLRGPDGLGPLYIRTSCSGCHRADGRGPGLVAKMAVVESDRVTPAADQSALPYGVTQKPYTAAGARRAILAPDGVDKVRVTYRLPPAVFGRGYMEAVAAEEIERLAREASSRAGTIRGRIHRLHCAPTQVVAAGASDACGIGRFGLKARLGTLDDFTADALQNDMGITSPLRPDELPNPDGLRDDDKPGVDVTLDTVHAVADYMRLLELPSRASPSPRGAQLFGATLCATCHVPALKTRANYPVSALAGIDAPVYTDFLLHDLGADMGDGVVDGEAGSREWRTAPLMGLRFFGAFMHDGRAHTLDEAVASHAGPGSEANESVDRFRALGATDRAELLRFVGSL